MQNNDPFPRQTDRTPISNPFSAFIGGNNSNSNSGEMGIDGAAATIQVLTTITGGEGTDAKVDFTPWCPLSSVREFRVERDFCRVIYDAHGDVVEMYINTVAHWNEHNMHEVTVETAKTIVFFVTCDIHTGKDR